MFGVATAPEKQIELSEKNMAQRYEYCRRYRRKDGRFWNKVVFSDEMSVRLIPDAKHLTTRRSSTGEKAKIPKRHSAGGQVMFWGAFNRFGVGPLVTVGVSTIDSKKYVTMLKDNLLPYLDKLKTKVRGKIQFQQDGARSHTSKYTIEIFFEKHPDIEMFFHPASSSQLHQKLVGFYKI